MASPTYVFHVTGAMKSMLDHFAYRWMLHRPAKEMFGKESSDHYTMHRFGLFRSAARDLKRQSVMVGNIKICVFFKNLKQNILG